MRIRKRKTIGTRLHRVYFWLWDGMYDHLPDDAPDWAYTPLDLFESAAKWVLCKVYGHEPQRDHCGKPEHDVCGWCNRSMPHMWQPATPS